MFLHVLHLGCFLQMFDEKVFYYDKQGSACCLHDWMNELDLRGKVKKYFCTSTKFEVPPKNWSTPKKLEAPKKNLRYPNKFDAPKKSFRNSRKVFFFLQQKCLLSQEYKLELPLWTRSETHGGHMVVGVISGFIDNNWHAFITHCSVPEKLNIILR